MYLPWLQQRLQRYHRCLRCGAWYFVWTSYRYQLHARTQDAAAPELDPAGTVRVGCELGKNLILTP